MRKKINLSVALFLVVMSIITTFTVSYMCFSGEWTARRRIGSDSKLLKIAEAINIIDETYIGEYGEDMLVDGAIDGMIQSLGDRWSYYLTAEELNSYYMNMNNQYSGIGIVIEGVENGVLVTKVHKDSPAMDAMILEESVITKVEDTEISGMEMRDARDLIVETMNGKGTVRLTLINAGGEEYSVELSPRIIEVDPVEFKMVDGDIGLITVSNFEAKSAEQMQNAADTLIEQGASGLVFDMRYNPGGQLSELLQAMDYILPEGVVFVSKNKGEDPQYKISGAECIEMPMAVLVNAETYSAAEFFAAALSEFNWAEVIGEKTTGKGYAQITVPLNDGSAIHISSREYFTPNGRSLAGAGLTPDNEVELDEESQALLYYGRLNPENDAQLRAAIDSIRLAG